MTVELLPRPPNEPVRGSVLECRVSQRFGCELRASCQPVAARWDNDVTWPGTIRDISVGGIGLILGRRFEPGSALAIELPGSDTRPPDTLLAQVRHATRQPDGTWLLGCSFISQLSDDEVQSLLQLAQVLQAPTGDDNLTPDYPSESCGTNASPRIATVTDVLFVATATDGSPVHFVVRRLHPHHHWPLYTGAILSLRLRSGASGSGCVKVKVDRCCQEQGRWTIHCWVMDQPLQEVLRLVGLSAT